MEDLYRRGCGWYQDGGGGLFPTAGNSGTHGVRYVAGAGAGAGSAAHCGIGAQSAGGAWVGRGGDRRHRRKLRQSAGPGAGNYPGAAESSYLGGCADPQDTRRGISGAVPGGERCQCGRGGGASLRRRCRCGAHDFSYPGYGIGGGDYCRGCFVPGSEWGCGGDWSCAAESYGAGWLSQGRLD